MKKIINNESSRLNGGIDRGAYCSGLASLLTGGGYQGDISWGMSVFVTNCSNYGYSLY